jgi:cytidylate kinase
VAIDGSAASGKSTVGRRVAAALGYRFLDTGVMYRAVTLAALDAGLDPDDEDGLTQLAQRLDIRVTLPDPGDDGRAKVLLDGVDVTSRLRATEVDRKVSLVSRVAGVRQALLQKQREIAARYPVVMAGRDIGTVVLRDAGLKVYLDASLEERARRRREDFAGEGRALPEGAVLDDIRRRDRIDSEREISPLRPAPDAVVIRTDGLDIEQVVEQVLALAGRLS